MSRPPRATGKGLMVTVGVNVPVTLKISIQTQTKATTTKKIMTYDNEILMHWQLV